MVTINELYIPQNGNSIILKAEVKSDTYYQNVYIDKIYVDTQDTYTGDFSKVIYTYTCPNNTKNLSLEISALKLLKPIKDNLFIVSIVTKGTPSSDTPCGMDKDTTVSAVFDSCEIYTTIISALKMGLKHSSCEISKTTMDILLKYELFKKAIETEHIDTAITAYKMFTEDFTGSNIVISKSCKCNE